LHEPILVKEEKEQVCMIVRKMCLPLFTTLKLSMSLAMHFRLARSLAVLRRIDSFGNPLVSAVRRQRLDEVDRCSTGTFNVDEKSFTGYTALSAAAEQGDLRMIHRLLETQAGRLQAFHTALEAGQASAFEVLLNEQPAVIESEELSRLLNSAVYHRQPWAVRTLLKRGVRNRNAIVTAATFRAVDLFEILLGEGEVDGDQPADCGWTPLARAAQSGSLKIVELLLVNGANPNYVCGQGTTALHQAAARGDTNIVKALLQHGANPDIRDFKGRDVCEVAVRNLRPSVTLFLRARRRYLERTC
jgi:ankyrin repeat protein